MELTKRDLSLTYGGRTFAVRAYRDESGPGGPGWHAVIIENRTPLLHEQGANSSIEGCFADAVRLVTASVEAHTSVPRARA